MNERHFKKVYIYGLLDGNNNIFYVGKSVQPQGRLASHSFPPNTPKRLKILDIFKDKEWYWINKLIEEGAPLINKEKLITQENWGVGDIISIITGNSTRSQKRRIKNKLTGKVYPSGYYISNNGLGPFGLVGSLEKCPNSKYHKEWEIVD